MKHYDGTKILSLKDINGETPELYLISTNRSGGKTTYFGRLLINRFIKYKKKFMIIYRNKFEIEDNVPDKFFKDIKDLFFPKYEMTEKVHKPVYTELFLNDIPCGYAVSLNASEQIKKLSHFFSDVDYMLFDEFQPESDVYVPQEIKKFISIHTSIARGHGQSHRYVPVYMLSNPISIINPYYTALGITNRLTAETKFLKGDGFVVEQGYVEEAAQAQRESGFNKAFKNEKYVESNLDGIYLNDNKIFIERPTGKSKYFITLKYKNNYYGVREFTDAGVFYVDNTHDKTFPVKLAVTTDDMDINYICLKNNKATFDYLRYFFHKGVFRFKDLKCKECLFTALIK